MNCITLDCTNPARPQRRKCRACEKAAWRAAHPERHLYDNLRTHAKARGIAFALTLSQFCAFAEATGYVEAVGQEANSLTVDRIDHRKGYEAGNIDAVTHRYNSTKGAMERLGIPFSDALEATE